MTSFAANEPIFIKGQQGATKEKIRDFQAPNNLATKLGTEQFLIETGNKNILDNPSFEHSTFSTSWTNSAGTFTQEASVLIDGKASAKLVLSAQTMSLTQSSALYAAQFADGVQGLAMVRVKSDIALKVCSIQAGIVSTTNCVTTATDSKWGLYKIPFILGATSNGISIASTGSVSGTVYVDEAFVGSMNLESQNGACVTADCTTTFSVTVSSAGVASQENIDFVNSCSRSAVGTYGCSFKSGIFSLAPNCLVNPTTSSFNTISRDVIATSSGIGYKVVNVGGTPTLNDQEVTIICQKQGADFTQAEAMKTGNVFTTQCGANCVDTLEATVSTAGAISKTNVAGWITSGAGALGIYAVTFTAGTFTEAPSCTCNNNSGNTRSCAVTAPTLSGATVTTTTNGTVATNAIFNISCAKVGADFVATRTIQGTFNEVNVSPGITKPKTCHYAFGGASATLAVPTECTSGTCVEVYDSCGTAAPPAFGSTGAYGGVVFSSGTFANSSFIDCKCYAFDVSSGTSRHCSIPFVTAYNTWSVNASGGASIYITSFGTTGTADNTYVTLTCKGQAP